MQVPLQHPNTENDTSRTFRNGSKQTGNSHSVLELIEKIIRNCSIFKNYQKTGLQGACKFQETSSNSSIKLGTATHNVNLF